MKNFTSNPKDLQLRMSTCCEAKVMVIPACFGDPEIKLCNKCDNHCEVKHVPLYQEVSRGTYRRIEYPNFPDLLV